MKNSASFRSAASVVAFLCLTDVAAAASLGGVVTSSGRSVDSATVSIYDTRPGGGKIVTITNAAGVYLFGNVRSGAYIVVVEKDGRRIYQGRTSVPESAAKFDIRL